VGSPERRDRLGRQHAAADLVFLDRLEKRLEVPLPESVVALPLDELEEDRPNDGLGEDLQEYLGGAAVDDAPPSMRMPCFLMRSIVASASDLAVRNMAANPCTHPFPEAVDHDALSRRRLSALTAG